MRSELREPVDLSGELTAILSDMSDPIRISWGGLMVNLAPLSAAPSGVLTAATDNQLLVEHLAQILLRLVEAIELSLDVIILG
ncbi:MULTISPECIES: hypothetical protein [unclassified Bradyrhizobium]|uniref:hypothetical protein n=1 Tax=unclassified Bradyrhizobium TaxID=2631580 RepID=UPI001FFAA7BD|nr:MULTISPECIES: hypothetical protein [unclassified Bradyrhizobium]MCK1710157.1 hypothetical protein [Bradyrhizobium sp. 143]MCK1725646.1 hypothetical protein [Bradyrhizobium sp. 142]